jgi:uncharacterized protein (TIGR00299 family) protein
MKKNNSAWFDCFSGISGDMCLGALVDAGASFDSLKRSLKKLPLQGYTLKRSDVMRSGLRALKIDVKVSSKSQPARTLKQVKEILSKSSLAANVKKQGMAVFDNIFRAEGFVHGVAPSKVHLHEMGALDVIVDVMGTLLALESLNIKNVYASPINLGTGTVKTSHGILPVPAPATAELLKGVPVYAGDFKGELTTPTGAAIIKTIASGFGTMPTMKVNSIGVGAGGRDSKGHPNVLRVFMGEAGSDNTGIIVMEANIDDMSPEIFPYVMDLLMRTGALDVTLNQVLMKKGRPAMVLTVQCHRDKQQALEQIILTETTTLGVRYWEAGRTVLARALRKVETRYGMIRVKDALDAEGKVMRSAPEYEDCARAAKKYKVPLIDVMKEAGNK